MTDLNNYKEVLEYLKLDNTADKFYTDKVLKKLDKVLSNPIYFRDLYKYFTEHANNLTKVRLFSNDWYLIVAALIIEKDIYPKRFLIDPFYRLTMCINTWIVETNKAISGALTKDSIAKLYSKPGLLQSDHTTCIIQK